MLNPDNVAQLRKAVKTDPDLQKFQNFSIQRSEIRLADPQRAQIINISPAQTKTLTPPARIFGTPFDSSCLNGIRSMDLTVPGKYLYTLPQAKIIGNNVVLGPNGEAYCPAPVLEVSDMHRLLEQNATNHQGFVAEQVDDKIHVHYATRKLVKHFQKRAMFLHNLEPSNYGSFMFRQLPQLLMLRESIPAFDLYIVPERTAWFSQALQMIGLPEKPIFTVKEVTGDTFDAVTLFNEFDAEGFLSDDISSRMLALARTVWPSSIYPYSSKLYISRMLSSITRPEYRLLSNEGFVETFFERRGYTIVYPETLSLPQQISLFRQAKTIAGPSGSGMLNAIFSEPDTRVLDMESFHYTVRQHAKIYSSTAKHYAFLFGELDPQSNLLPYIRPWSLSQDVLDAAYDWLAS